MEQNLDTLRDPAPLVPFVKARLQRGGRNTKGLWGLAIAYIDARAAAAVLDAALGTDGWSFEHTTPVRGQKGWLTEGTLTLHLRGPGGEVRNVVREDIGTGGGSSDAELDLETGAKGSVSDALKRCAAQVGVGRAVYALPEMFVDKMLLEERGTGDKAKVQIKRDAGPQVAAMFRGQLEKLADQYRRTGAEPGEPTERPAEPADDTPAPPAGHQVDPSTGEVTPSEQAADAAWAAAGGDAMAATAAQLGAPGPGTGWEERIAWVNAREGGGDAAKATLTAIIGGRPTKAKITEDATWARVLLHYAEAETTTNAEAA